MWSMLPVGGIYPQKIFEKLATPSEIKFESILNDLRLSDGIVYDIGMQNWIPTDHIK